MENKQVFTSIYDEDFLNAVQAKAVHDRQAKVDVELLNYFQEARELRIRKDKDYKSSWRDLGAKGLFVRIRDKVNRLKSLLWDGNDRQVDDENLRDTAVDLVNYGLYLIYCLDHGMMTGDDK